MKTCACCGALVSDADVTCPECGEASFLGGVAERGPERIHDTDRSPPLTPSPAPVEIERAPARKPTADKPTRRSRR